MTRDLAAWLDRVTEFSLFVFIFTLPFSKSLMEVFFIIALASWLIRRLMKGHSGGRRIFSVKKSETVSAELNLPIAVFVTAGFLSMINSTSIFLSLEGFFLKLLEWVMLYFIVAETVDSRRKLNRILAVMLLSMVLISIDGLFQHVTGTDFIRNYAIPGHRIQGPFGTSNSFAGWLVVIIPLGLTLSFFGTGGWPEGHRLLKKFVKPALWIMVILLIVCLVLTYSRGAWISFGLSMVFLGILKSRKLLLITMAALLILFFTIPDSVKNRAGSITGFSEKKIDRPALWFEALTIIEDFPILGSGLNTYASIGPHYRTFEEGGYYPHNSYLHMAAESGLLGLGAFLWIIAVLFRAACADLKRMAHGFNGIVLTGLLAGLFGFLVHSFVDVNIYTLQLGGLMWFTIGLITAVRSIHNGDVSP